MRKSVCAILAVFFLLLSLPSLANTTYTGAGTYTGIPTNCGFEIPTDGWITVTMWNDSDPIDLFGLAGPFPLRIKSVTLYGGSSNPSSITVYTGAVCVGTVYNSGWVNEDVCEVDPNRPEIADPSNFLSWGDLRTTNAIIPATNGYVDFLTTAQGDDSGERWNSIAAHGGALYPANIRRCRLVDGGPTFFTHLAE